MKYRIAIVIPFFGELNCKGYFQLFLDSCAQNKFITWFLITNDRTTYNYPENVCVKYQSFEELRGFIQNQFDFPISLNTPYKLCDFKPAYGNIFKEMIRDYDWWGFGDIDLIWGNASHFITEELLENNEQLYSRGHLTISKNNEKMRLLYQDQGGKELYRKIFSEERSYAFDELHISGGFREIVARTGIQLYDELDFADIAKQNWFDVFSFELAQAQLKSKEKNIGRSIFCWSPERLERIYYQNRKLISKEFLYIHLQRRNLKVLANRQESFCIVPNSILDTPAKITPMCIWKMHLNYGNIQTAMLMIIKRIEYLDERIKNRIKMIPFK